MKTYFILFLCYLSFASVYSQNDIQIEYGAVFKNEKREIPFDIVGKDENGYYLLYSEGKYGQGDDMFLRKFNLDLTPSGQELNLKDETYENKFSSLGVTKINDNIIHVFSLMTDTGKKYYYQFVNLNTFELSEKKFITEIENDTKNANNSISRFIISDDENTITLFYTIPNKNKETAKIRVQTFDSSFVEQTNTTYEFPYNNDVLSIRSVFSNKNKELFILCKVYDSSKILSDESKHQYEFQLFKVTSDNLKLLTKIRPNNVHLRHLSTTLFDDNKLVLTGLFSVKDMYAMTGVFSAKIDLETGKQLYANYNTLSTEFFSKLMSDGKKKDKAILKYNEGKRENPNYILKNTIKLDNDELLVLAEQNRSFTYNYVTTYYSDNIAAIKLDNQGNVIWSNKIGKRNEKANVYIYNSFFPILKNDAIYLFYNGNSKNLNHKTGFIANSFGSDESVFLSTKIDAEGNYTRHILCTKEELEGVTIRPSLYNWIDDNTLLMFGQDIDNLKNQRFIKVIFK
ncbi:hypothetical protein [Yeosuana marina]|uniref:hypothetical protein n=1 Tax=Yeosuana marina TaxID=1565536 RepID=UPI0030EF4771|tara:strand:+ start:2122 stop:3660 length:1539 start_codon:yes stop_codon:yes gene_type:complete